ncbi:hypothetical protein NA57DRAFT_74961 [Rhizodiscina lignyota]|uniref:HCP-like protein n=1 Tax=Rhizodiscina lignyota TaxID=1504668 RepID=A0A9P4M679_9PEZI|nr:hypothetical protein NA57DRAFT_74961 [Rhizodiscina lignyota]
MVLERPRNLDLTGTSFNEHRIPTQSPGDLAPPKTGDIPPALSPLDAFALQSRLLARKFEEEQQNGRRISRLPPLTIQNEFAKRPGYFRSTSSETSSAVESPADDTPNTGKLNESPLDIRPRSQYPTIEGNNDDGSFPKQNHKPVLSGIGEEETEPPQLTRQPMSYFDIPRAVSPEPIETRIVNPTPTTPSSRLEGMAISPPANFDSLSIDSVTSPNQSLRPPRSPMQMNALKHSPSIRSVYDSSDDVEPFSMAGSLDSLPPRKPSTNSSYSRSHSPAIPYAVPLPRSPSAASASSWTSAPRPSFNFSRPMSSTSRPSLDHRGTNETSISYRQGTMDSTSTRPSLDVPSRQNTGDSPLTPMSNEMPKTPLTIASEDSFTGDSDVNPAQVEAYTYTKYALPRGRAMNRESIAPGDFILKQFEWSDSFENSRISLSRSPSPDNRRLHTPNVEDSPPFLPIQTSVSFEEPRQIHQASDSTGSPRQRRVLHKQTHSTPSTTPSATPDKTKTIRSIAPSNASITTSSDASTIKAQLRPTQLEPTAQELTPEQHLQKGIELHEAGSLQESTYHLRIAAKAGHATAMLLYALACRHGWGMRASQAEGVRWLQRAVDSAQLECADDEDLIKRSGGQANPTVLSDRKTHKAQFALSVYELGMSYMNGWGVRQDRALGLRCFEVAGNWGDADALTEAAFCYAEGVGCRKDLKRAAGLYREAERRGMSMAGNSWIYKDKYMDDASSNEGRRSRPSTKDGREKGKGKRDKSRTRKVFGRKKSFANGPPP